MNKKVNLNEISKPALSKKVKHDNIRGLEKKIIQDQSHRNLINTGKVKFTDDSDDSNVRKCKNM